MEVKERKKINEAQAVGRSILSIPRHEQRPMLERAAEDRSIDRSIDRLKAALNRNGDILRKDYSVKASCSDNLVARSTIWSHKRDKESRERERESERSLALCSTRCHEPRDIIIDIDRSPVATAQHARYPWISIPHTLEPVKSFSQQFARHSSLSRREFCI